MKKLFTITVLTLAMTGCAGVNWTSVGGDVVEDFSKGLVAAQDAYTAYQALNQNLTTANVTTGKLTFDKVLTAANLSKTALNTPGLFQAVTDLFNSAKTTITDLQAKNVPTSGIISTVSSQGATAVTAVAALASPTTSNLKVDRFEYLATTFPDVILVDPNVPLPKFHGELRCPHGSHLYPYDLREVAKD